MPFNFFAIIAEGNERLVRRIRVSSQIQTSLTDLFTEQATYFVSGDAARLTFDVRYHIRDESEVFEVENFALPAVVQNAVSNPNQPDDLDLTPTTVLKAILAVEQKGRSTQPRIYFQSFAKVRMLKPQFTILQQKNTFRRLDEPGLTLDTKLVAVYEQGKLLFRSYTVVNQFLDLTQVFAEATDEDIKQVLKEKNLYVGSDVDIAAMADTQLRRKFSAVKQSGVLKTLDVAQAVSKAKKYDLDLAVQGTGRKKQLVFPAVKADAKQLLNFLLEGYYQGELTGQRYIANSHRPIKTG